MKTRSLLKYIVLMMAVILFAVCCSIFSFESYSASADTGAVEGNEMEEESAEDIETRLFTNLSLSINCGDGKVWATVKNDFTLFPSTVIVIVQLYSSETYAESYEQMTYMSANSTNDLDMGNTITTEASTGGVEKFWLGRMRYKVDNGDWASKQTAACRISASGEFLGYV